MRALYSPPFSLGRLRFRRGVSGGAGVRDFSRSQGNDLGYYRGMNTITIDDLKRDPLDALRRVESGETLLVLRDQKAIAEIKPMPREPRPFGLAAGQFTVPKNFDDPLPPELLHGFDGR